MNLRSWQVHVAVLISATVKLIVNMDKDLPGLTGELPPLQLTYVKDLGKVANPPSAAAAPDEAAPRRAVDPLHAARAKWSDFEQSGLGPFCGL